MLSTFARHRASLLLRVIDRVDPTSCVAGFDAANASPLFLRRTHSGWWSGHSGLELAFISVCRISFLVNRNGRW